jgi:TatA/E family protein of Tat protein translocase
VEHIPGLHQRGILGRRGIMTGILALLGGLGTPELIAIFLIVFVLFGAKKLPELARGLGKSLGEFKKARAEFEDELLKNEEVTPKKDASTSNNDSSDHKE